jgi:hypothetical protein
VPTISSLLKATTYSPALIRGLGPLVALLVFAASLSATPVSGTLHINSTTVAGVDQNTTDFNYAGGTPSDTTFGQFLVLGDSTGSFSPFIGTNGTIRSFNRTDVPLGAPTAYANFINLPSPTPTIEFVLTKLFAGTGGACTSTSTTCTPPSSPFVLTDTATGSTAAFSVNVEAINLLTGETSLGAGTFSEAIIGQDVQQVLATIASGGVEVHGYGAEFDVTFPTTRGGSPTPEPASVTLFAGGLVLVLAGLVRRVARRQNG